MINTLYLSANVTQIAHDRFIAVFHLGVAIDIRRANTIRDPIAVQEIVLEVNLGSVILSTVFYRGNRVILIAVLVLVMARPCPL